jgi:hypothetical protein
MPVPEPTAPSSGGPSRNAVETSAAVHAAATSSRAHLHPTGVVEVGVVALGDHRDDEVLRDPLLLLEHQLTRGVVDPAELQRRREADRGLDGTPLGCGDEPRALSGAVEHGATGHHRPVEGVIGDPQHSDPGAGHPAPLRRVRLVAPHSGMADAHARQRPAPSSSVPPAAGLSVFPVHRHEACGHPAARPGILTTVTAASCGLVAHVP